MPEKSNTKPAPTRGLGYHFIPLRFQRANTLKWLKRIHAWTGLWGALLFLFMGISGFLLNHRSIMEINTGEPTALASVEVSVDPQFITSEHALRRWVAKQFDVSAHPSQTRSREPQKARFNGKELVQPAKWEAQFRGPNGRLVASYVDKSGTVELRQEANTFLGTLKNLHKGSGVSVLWILFLDSVAGALIFMSLTGILLWSKLHGPRLVGIALVFGSFTLGVTATLPYWVTSSL